MRMATAISQTRSLPFLKHRCTKNDVIPVPRLLCFSLDSMPSSMFKYALGGAIASYFGYRSSRCRSVPAPFPDRAQVIYPAIDWKTSVIGGSYALRQFRGNIRPGSTAWEPKDIDIMIGCKSDEEFEQAVKQFEANCPAAKLSDGYAVYGRSGHQYGETFNRLVRGSLTYHHPEAGMIELVNVRTREGRSLQSVLAETVDAPACLSYTLDIGNPDHKIWHIPDKGREALLTGWVNEKAIGSSTRRRKVC